ncbi:MAG: helix-turn-helix transcriptional regulator [Inconstantimicrobium porci]|uniref:helix-turn-helix transcriptional regulator n=1 Tax=Inconstantimicrobium porci TaxID=2652291 RepID=UPI002A90FB9C|nr:helix-turn-helix transcriptional regulator [Inconstantimicrobium porci]MDY5913267.1 helix-turn-helix transcriptional regulator [Inconstantimicrobium porci]
MKLSEKIQFLRKQYGYSQEDLAETCSVSRQSISKWEADISLPEVDKLLIISRIFKTSVDVLLKDELEVSGVKEVHSCDITDKKENKNELYTGLIIKESIADENIFDYVFVNKTELWKTNNSPKYWTAVYFSSSDSRFPELLSKALKSDKDCGVNWFTDMKQGNIKIIVFNKKILRYTIGNKDEKEKVFDECRKLGIPDFQLDWEE